MRGAIEHYSGKSVTLLTNNFELSVEVLTEIYKRRWAIENLYKHLKQHFPLHFLWRQVSTT
ncbi:transposase [Alloprevotella sp. oral taxon 473]|uniref:transposase n=1 Tax=Alloprevotella sp. oral taxon 473 TaxID=712469 RepID=UPI0012EDC9CB